MEGNVMPEPVRAGQRYMPGLDGLRALAVLAVIAFHEQLGWAPGGLLGVGVFFTLSGYLITDLLLGQWATAGRPWPTSGPGGPGGCCPPCSSCSRWSPPGSRSPTGPA